MTGVVTKDSSQILTRVSSFIFHARMSNVNVSRFRVRTVYGIAVRSIFQFSIF